VRLLSAESLSPSVRSMTFETVDGRPVGQQPGQWVNLFVDVPAPEAPASRVELRRSYSIASEPEPGRASHLEIAVTLVDGGPVSALLHSLPLGSTVGMDGPWGVFTLERGDAAMPMVFVGTGTGVTPLRAMLRAELAARPTNGPPIVLLFGCRTPEDLLYRGEMEALARSSPRFTYVPTLSRAADSWPGKRGHVQQHLPGILAGLGQSHVFVCGLSKMVQDVRRLLKEDLGFDRKQIHTERYD
jgi:CDP-4-dehydro-6-deoxyglucose reductase